MPDGGTFVSGVKPDLQFAGWRLVIFLELIADS